MSKKEKLIEKARQSPQNIAFDELKNLFQYSGFENKGQDGTSHVVYRLKYPPHTMYPIQCGKCGKAKEYQVNWLIDWIDENIRK